MDSLYLIKIQRKIIYSLHFLGYISEVYNLIIYLSFQLMIKRG